MKYLCDDADMPCDVCGAETGETEWVGTPAGVKPARGAFLCPLCKRRSGREQFDLALRLEKLRVVT